MFCWKKRKTKKKWCSSLEIICILNLDVKINVPPPSTKLQKLYIFPKKANVLNYKSKESLTFKTVSRKNVTNIQIGSIWWKKQIFCHLLGQNNFMVNWVKQCIQLFKFATCPLIWRKIWVTRKILNCLELATLSWKWDKIRSKFLWLWKYFAGQLFVYNLFITLFSSPWWPCKAKQ